jgi:hypothetical protein
MVRELFTGFETWQSYLSGHAKNKTVFDQIEEQINSCLNSKAALIETKIPNTHADSPSILSNNPTQLIDTKNSETSPVINEKITASPKNLAQAFIPWFKQQIASGAIHCNQANGVLYRVEEGLFVVITEIVTQFQKEYRLCQSNPLRPAFVKKTLVRAIIEEGDWIKNSRDQPWHTYLRGRWGQRETLQGFLLPIADLWGPDESQWPTICTDLEPDIVL